MATGDEHIEAPTGLIDGVNVTFTTSIAYQPGTLFVWLNGQLLALSDFEWVETGAFTFDMSAPPKVSDRLKCRFLEV